MKNSIEKQTEREIKRYISKLCKENFSLKKILYAIQVQFPSNTVDYTNLINAQKELEAQHV